jgi:hypothetical protein
MVTKKKPTQKTKKADECVWPFPDTVWNISNEYVIEHWNELLMNCLAACAELGLDCPAEICPTNRLIDGFNLESVIKLVSRFDWNDESILMLRPPTKFSELDRQKDILEACSELVKRKREQEAKEERRKRAIASLTPEQKEALGL